MKIIMVCLKKNAKETAREMEREILFRHTPLYHDSETVWRQIYSFSELFHEKKKYPIQFQFILISIYIS
jgi:hypothetical protein